VRRPSVLFKLCFSNCLPSFTRWTEIHSLTLKMLHHNSPRPVPFLPVGSVMLLPVPTPWILRVGSVMLRPFAFANAVAMRAYLARDLAGRDFLANNFAIEGRCHLARYVPANRVAVMVKVACHLVAGLDVLISAAAAACAVY